MPLFAPASSMPGTTSARPASPTISGLIAEIPRASSASPGPGHGLPPAPTPAEVLQEIEIITYESS
jgi:hypothetical protein